MISCNGLNKTVYEEYKTIENLSWYRFDILKFSADLEYVDKPYDILLNVRHLPLVRYEEMEINLTIYTASGDMRSTDYTIDFYDRDDKRLSNCMGDYCDLRTTLRTGFLFAEPGVVRFEVENKYTKLEMPGIMEIGLLLVESKED
jgi:gliding motility-associated lipoprotein GldH